MRLRNYSSNISFLDTFLLTLIGITAILAIVVKLINPIAEQGKIDPVTEFMLTLEWRDNLPPDLDIHVRTPNGDIINFRNKDNGWVVLDRDDLGTSSDLYNVDGVVKQVPKNMEVVNINAVVPGEYVVTVYYYSTGGDMFWEELDQDDLVMREYMDYTVTLFDMRPFSVKYTANMTGITYRNEQTIMSFVVDDEGEIQDIRTDINIPLYSIGAFVSP